MRTVLAVAVMFIFAGCATTGDVSHFNDGSVEQWLAQVAAPELGHALSTHPRFSDETVRIAVMHGQTVQLRSDGLSVALRDSLHARLLGYPGLQVLVHDAPGACDTPESGYLVAVELTRMSTDRAQVQLRVYDVVERQWISGFGSRWQGSLSSRQRRLAADIQVSEGARGTRVLPFEKSQSDLLAQQLAADLACKLRRSGDDERVVTPARHRGAALVAGNLVGHRIPVASGGQYSLDTRVHEVDRGLYQVWAVLTSTDSEARSYTTNAYASAPLLQSPPARFDRNERSPRVAVTPQRKQRPQPVALMIDNARLAAPSRGQGCGRPPDALDSDAPKRSGVVDAGECFAIEFDADPSARIFIVSHGTDDDYVRVFPSQCTPGGIRDGLQSRHRFPARGAIGWDARGGDESFYLVAARGRAAARIEALVHQLPSACERTVRSHGAAWRRQLDAAIAAVPAEAGYATVHVRHVNGRVARRMRQ